jgi:hypothetical protein
MHFSIFILLDSGVNYTSTVAWVDLISSRNPLTNLRFFSVLCNKGRSQTWPETSPLLALQERIPLGNTSIAMGNDAWMRRGILYYTCSAGLNNKKNQLSLHCLFWIAGIWLFQWDGQWISMVLPRVASLKLIM